MIRNVLTRGADNGHLDRKPYRRSLVAAAAVTSVAMATAAAGCSSNDSSTNGGKSPIKVMVISTLQSPAFGFPEAVDGAKAAAAKINAAGGVDGRQIEIESCNDQFDPNAAAACAQKAVSQKVSGVVTGYTPYGSKILPALQAAKIPFVGLIPGTDTEWNSPAAFPFGAGSTGNLVGVAIELADQKCTKAGVITGVDSTSNATGEAVKAAFKQRNVDVVYTTTIPPTAADVSPQTAALVKAGAKCVVTVIPPAVKLSFIKAAYAADDSMLIGLSGLDDPAAAKLGPASKNLVKGDTVYPATSDQLKPFVADLHAFNASGVVSTWSLNAYTGVQAIAQVAGGLDKVDGASLTAALNKAAVTLTGYPKPVNFSKPLAIKGITRMFSTDVVTASFDGAHFIAYPQPVKNVLSVMQAIGGAS
ncbi:conserved exported hypothetical protein [Frankia canadensis]|uniref:Leucine-binding protein domain-containing protein n=1 Tax=Frankia canadensis TaxID=1836972 RepID=A0A2I2KHZ3_9ACTN|nr:ABC transporter substrate-binding protein [Frankia canadensis]SNQ45249.1 conserved exported hypothetical protein [Frankia canadensis]SOU52539.1 conserved exported hypothetical protein [Frankia canadensis]